MDGNAVSLGRHDEYIVSLCRIAAAKSNLSVIFSDEVDTFSIRRIESGEGASQRSSWIVMISNKALATDDSKTFESILYGAIYHECVAHGRHTEMSWFGKASNKPLLHAILNVIEDARAERAAWEDFPGGRMLLEDMAVILENPDRVARPFWIPDPMDTAENKLVKGLVRHLRVANNLQPLDAERTRLSMDYLREILGQQRLDRIVSLALAGAVSDSTKGAYKAAEAILKELHEHNKQANQPQQPNQKSGPGSSAGQGNDQGDDAGDPSQGAAGGNQPGKGQGGTPGKGDPGDAGGAAGNGNDPGAGGQQGGAGGSRSVFDTKADPKGSIDQHGPGPGGTPGTGGKPGQNGQGTNGQGPSDEPFEEFSDGIDIDATVEQAIHNAIRGLVHKTSTQCLAVPVESRGPAAGSVSGKRGHSGIGSLDAVVPVFSSNQYVARMRNVIQKIVVEAGVEPDELPSKHGQTLDTGNLAMIAAGLETRPFLEDQGEHAPGIDAEIEFLFDASGSAKQLGEDFIRQSIMALGNALSGFVPRIHFGITYFAGTVLRVFDSREQSWFRERSIVAGRYSAGGGTMWTPGAIDLMARLSCSKHKRRMLITTSDGELESGQDIDRAIASFSRHRVEATIISMEHALNSANVVMSPKTPEGFCKAMEKSIARTFRRNIQQFMP